MRIGNKNSEYTAVAQLRYNFPVVTQKAEGVYEVPLKLSEDLVVPIEIAVPPNFPQAPPRIRLYTTMNHSIVRDREVFPRQLSQWGPSSTLLQIVTVIHQAFLSTAPIALSEKAPDFLQLLQPGERLENDDDIEEFLFSRVLEAQKLEEMRDKLLLSNNTKVHQVLGYESSVTEAFAASAGQREEAAALSEKVKGLMKQVESMKRTYSTGAIAGTFAQMYEKYQAQAAGLKEELLRGALQLDTFKEQYFAVQSKVRLMNLLQGPSS